MNIVIKEKNTIRQSSKERRKKKKLRHVAKITPFCTHVGKPNNDMKTMDKSPTFLYNEYILLMQEYCNKQTDLIEQENACLAKLSS